MGWLRSLITGSPDPVMSAAISTFDAEPSQTFAVDADSIDPAVFGLSSYSSPTAPAPRIDRRSAMQVPGVKRARDLVAGTLGGLPLDLFGPGQVRSHANLFEQPERDVPRSVTMVRLFEDMLFEGVAWWQITEFGWHTYPVKVKRLDPRLVTVNDDPRPCGKDGCSGKVMVGDKHVHDDLLIRFDSPSDPLLVAGARAIRTCLALEAAAQRHSDGAPPVDYFTPADDADPFEDDAEVVTFLNGWQTARQARSTGYVPASVKYNVAGWNPEQLQMVEQRQHAVLEIARCAGIDPEAIGVSTTSRTYFNAEHKRKEFVDFTLGGYLNAVQDRLNMGDVTPRGYYAKFNLNAFLRSDAKTRMETYEKGLVVGAYTKDEIRELEDKPALALPAGQTNPQEAPVAASTDAPQVSFDDAPITFDAPTGEVFSVDVEKRVIRGRAVPYGVEGQKGGRRFVFSKGTIDTSNPSRVKLWVNHDKAMAVGVAFELEDTDDGLDAAFKIARGPEGDRALTMAEDGVWDGLSIGPSDRARYATRNGVFHAVDIPLTEISLTPAPVFAGARVQSVNFDADADTNRGEVMPEETTTEAPADFSAITEAINAGFQNLQFPQRETVSAGSTVEVTEALPYRFDGVPGEHSFSADLRDMASGNSEARQRLETFMDEAFAVTTGNVTALNPTKNRPELYVPNLEFTRPLFNLVSTGVITDKTPFTVPKFSAAAGLVGAHTEGVEPTPGSFSATNQTVTPAPVSGKIEINREVWDQGGSPQADAIVWREMLNGYYEAIEAKIATMLNGLTLTEINLGGAVDAALVNAVQNIFIDLQFVRGGNRYSALALDGLLFKALVNAADSSGRKLLPVVSPANAQGQTAGNFGQVQIGSQVGAAAWALGATNTSNSYLFVPGSVWLWASAPKRFTFEYQVKSIDMAIWGYTGSAVLRDTDVKRIDYTTADV